MRAFVYGTLTHKPVLESVLGHVVGPQRRAVLCDHARFAVDGEIYPGLISKAGTSIEGLVFDVSAEDIQILDEFEGEEYVRTAVSVSLVEPNNTDTPENSSDIEANVYIYIGDLEKLKGSWSPSDFAATTGHGADVVKQLWDRLY
ncbi:hypothetical protein SARC_11532 [Sphaeroforma arctica JP610]|uniref:Putative gamma-glutamylcyclotransferase n=1 Tax=Sphaeroforma arctica JP610 TaxID=667725 RepID=A0A0L0FIU1_9EUKA|nr:hypothetical protein SARC_11532 [Sphaeroforma arctica JP610]KNC75953.1 hypothetical protein SARC_11532 [Sphaeroforma arctica JP610]|eukprot:XP_014149855.1 hypothetical protein SARC_11532 [Sphaeroforma arctica JP610]